MVVHDLHIFRRRFVVSIDVSIDTFLRVVATYVGDSATSCLRLKNLTTTIFDFFHSSVSFSPLLVLATHETQSL
jgi:hypothetical protein